MCYADSARRLCPKPPIVAAVRGDEQAALHAVDGNRALVMQGLRAVIAIRDGGGWTMCVRRSSRGTSSSKMAWSDWACELRDPRADSWLMQGVHPSGCQGRGEEVENLGATWPLCHMGL